jgi:glycine dehydrogenase
MDSLEDLLHKGDFATRHIGPSPELQREMLATVGALSLDALVREVVPQDILLTEPLALGEAKTENEALAEISAHAMRNEVWRNFIGTGYYGTHTPAVIQRNVLENPGWYTAYTPYQAEISQGRLEALLNFQQMVIDLTGLPVANASLLDEATAAAEAMAMIRRSSKSKASAFFVDAAVHPQVLAVMRTRAKWLGIELVVGDDVEPQKVFGAHLQYPDTYGRVRDFSDVIKKIHAAQGLVSMGTDLLALVLLRSPGALGADIAIGSAQRFGVPLGYGGPHAAFMACRDEHKRSMPGRIIGVSNDAAGRPALRMALQTREQHIRRD